jgi:hypothetical protein
VPAAVYNESDTGGAAMPIHDWTRVDAGIFHDFHLEMICSLSRALNNGVLPSDYYALIEPGTSLHPNVPNLSRLSVRNVTNDRVVARIEVVSPCKKTTQIILRSFTSKLVEFLDSGVHLLVMDLFPPGVLDPQGIHGAIWSNLTSEEIHLPADTQLMLVSYSAGVPQTAYMEPIAVGETLPDMPLFLQSDTFIPIPLEAAYRAAFNDVPARWRDVLERPQGNP